jgi:hypothetical protein
MRQAAKPVTIRHYGGRDVGQGGGSVRVIKRQGAEYGIFEKPYHHSLKYRMMARLYENRAFLS